MTEEIKEASPYELRLKEILNPLFHQDTSMIRKKIQQLKKSDGEGWACGEIVERALITFEALYTMKEKEYEQRLLEIEEANYQTKEYQAGSRGK